jgi:type II secretory pathway pseudopilin PulG
MGRIKNNIQKSLSFTLIEMLVVIGVIGLTLPAFFSIFFSLLRQQGKIYALSQVKREGDFALNTITNIIRNYGVSIHSSIPNDSNKINCPATETSILNYYLLDKYNSYFRFCKSSTGNNCDGGDNYIASYSSKLTPQNTIPLTTNKVQVTNFNLACTQTSPFSPPIIKLIFTVTYKTASNRPEDTASLTYQTQIKMKSY